MVKPGRMITALLATALGLAGAPARALDMPAPRVLVVTDIGASIDDQWALAQAALERGVDLVGVLTTHSPALAYPAPKTAARHAKELLAAVGRPEVPVVPGLVEPFGGEQDIKPGPAADYLLAASRGHSRERPLRVLMLGPATDVALALVVDPTLADRIEVAATGFDAWPNGGDRWNVKQDPLAWKLVLQSRTPLVVGDAAVGKRDLVLTRERMRTLAASRGRAGAYLARLYEAWLDKDPAHRLVVSGQPDAWPLWDQAPLAWLLGHAGAETYARPSLADDLTLKVPSGRPNGRTVRWITRVDADALWASFTAALDRRAAAER